MGIFQLIYGTINTHDITHYLRFNDMSVMFYHFIPFGIPTFVAFFRFMRGFVDPSGKSTLDNVIEHRNNVMSHVSASEASEILKKTSHLDLMKNNQHINAFKNASKGFEAEVGTSSASKTLRKLRGL